MNPFRNALITYDLLPDDRKPLFFDTLMIDWHDLEHNANPIEHTPARDEYEAISYVESEFGGGEDSRDLRPLFVRLANAWDRLLEDGVLPESDTTKFAGEKVSSGHYIDTDVLYSMFEYPTADLQILRVNDYDSEGNETGHIFALNFEGENLSHYTKVSE